MHSIGTRAPRSVAPDAHELEDELRDLRHELERSERRVAAMKRIQRILGSNLHPDALLTKIVTATTELLDADRSTLFLIDKATGELVSKVMQADALLKEIRMPAGKGLAGWVASSGQPVHIADAYDDPRFNPEFDKRSGYRTRCMLVWPVRHPRSEQVIGVMQVLNKRKGPFTAEDERLLEVITTSIGVAVEVMTLHGEAVQRSKELERARAKLELLFDTERAISQGVELDAMLALIVETALERLYAKSAVLYLVDEQGETIRVQAARGAHAASLAKRAASLDDPILGPVVRGGESVVHDSSTGPRRGRVRVRRALAAPVKGPGGEILGVLELLNRKDGREYTEGDVRTLSMVAAQAGRAINAHRERVERERAGRLAAIGKMLSGIVHDLKTPMTLINGYSELMVSSEARADRDGFARGIQKQIDVMSAMTKELLAFARGERSVLVRKVYVSRFMDEMKEYLEHEFDGRRVRLDMDVRYRGPARFDETKLRRVFHNIARNASEAMPGGGVFSVRAAKKKNMLEIELADDGPGIPKEIEGRLFEAFSTSGKPGGTGLGLAMVKRIAEEHNGTVECQSSPGKGTRFIVSLPLGL